MKLPQLYRTVLSAQTGTFRDAATQENHINQHLTSANGFDDVVITKTIKIIPQPESLEEWRSEGPLQSQKSCLFGQMTRKHTAPPETES